MAGGEDPKKLIREIFDSQLKEIAKNKARFTVIVVAFILAVSLKFVDVGESEEEVNLDEPPKTENTSARETNPPAKNNPNKNIVPVKKASSSSAEKNITPVIGANVEEIFIHDPFAAPPQIQPKEIEIVEVTPAPPTPPPPTAIEPPPAQILNEPEKISEPAERFVLRGMVASGENKLAILEKIGDKNSSSESLILGVGDTIRGRRIIEIGEEFLAFDDGEKIYIHEDTN